eukprot:scaffold398_cov305-Prasinococcus_capsulatus_cf.AAC.2
MGGCRAAPAAHLDGDDEDEEEGAVPPAGSSSSSSSSASFIRPPSLSFRRSWSRRWGGGDIILAGCGGRTARPQPHKGEVGERGGGVEWSAGRGASPPVGATSGALQGPAAARAGAAQPASRAATRARPRPRRRTPPRQPQWRPKEKASSALGGLEASRLAPEACRTSSSSAARAQLGRMRDAAHAARRRR